MDTLLNQSFEASNKGMWDYMYMFLSNLLHQAKQQFIYFVRW
jgi:hypothetical protein